jgi:hypothetical protein
MKLTQALLLALAAVKFAQAIPQNNDFNANRFGGGNNNGGGNGQDTGNNGGDTGNNGGDTGNNGGDTGNNGGDTGNNGGDQGNNGGDNGQGGGNNNNGGGLCLDPANVQDGSNSPGEPDAAAGQSDSLTYVSQSQVKSAC